MDLSKLGLFIICSLLLGEIKASEQGPPNHPEEEYIFEWNTLEGDATVTWRYKSNGTHMYPAPVASDQLLCDTSISTTEVNESTSNSIPVYKILKGVRRRYFFADEYLSRCTECIAVAMQMNFTFERLTINDGHKKIDNNYKFHRDILGPHFCERAFQEYAHRVVDNIYFIGPETVNSELVEDMYNHMIPKLLFRECQRIRSYLQDGELYRRWVSNDYNMIKALCRNERGQLAACTRALVDFNPRELKIEVNQSRDLWQSFIYLILGRHIDRKLTEEYKILKAWYQNWDQ